MFTVLFIALLVMIVLDTIWIKLNMQTYNKLVQTVQKEAMFSPIERVIVAYIFLMFSVVTIMVPHVIRDSVNLHPIANAIRNGAVLGCSIYGIFNFTNYAMFKNYDLHTAILDTVWGTSLYFLTALIISYYLYLQP